MLAKRRPPRKDSRTQATGVLRGSSDPGHLNWDDEGALEHIWKREATEPEEDTIKSESTLAKTLREAREAAENLEVLEPLSLPRLALSESEPEPEPEPLVCATSHRDDSEERQRRGPTKASKNATTKPLNVRTNTQSSPPTTAQPPAPSTKPPPHAPGKGRSRAASIIKKAIKKKEVDRGCQTETLGAAMTEEMSSQTGSVETGDKEIQVDVKLSHENRRVRSCQTDCVETDVATTQCNPDTRDAETTMPTIQSEEGVTQTEPAPEQEDLLLQILRHCAPEGGLCSMDFGKDKRKLNIKIQNGRPAIHTGGGYMSVEDFLKRYRRIDPQNSEGAGS
ncbi:hypothetical protein CYMTET_9861 [Cymbomonas tetramitiformis]|uniref:Uncharacterized protein n=1 Tax=Cymbomonas tetramitiformis TaxID=36881 RepID=A0AAE0GQX5_9CHLO|nr:hypothetical protein CYMTET_9861 [Cymbomonas tetramitiformis]